ncbi:MAG: hypothetical protein NC034_01060, partial [Ruminococcus sp.]|nr:hypothetical protein [Ruminococcus sp.]
LVQKLGSRVGSFFVKEFEKTSIGCDGALEILNRISPKYTSVLSNLIEKYGSGLAKRVANAYNTNGIEKVHKLLDNECLFDELIQNGEKFTRENVMWITRDVEGKIVWLETGNSSAGFNHILTRHPVEQFSTFGVNSEADLSQLLLDTVSNKIPIGTYGGSGTVYTINENTYINIVIGSNGYVVTAHPITDVKDIAKIIFN